MSPESRCWIHPLSGPTQCPAVVICAVLALALVHAAPIRASDRAAPTPAVAGADSVSIRDQRMTVRLAGGSLRGVMRSVAEQSGIDVRFVGAGDREVASQSFTNVPLEKGIRRLLRDTQYAFVYSGKEPQARIAHVLVVLGDGDGTGAAAAAPEATAGPGIEALDTARLIEEVQTTLRKVIQEDPTADGLDLGNMPAAVMPDQEGMERLDEVVQHLSEQLRSEIQGTWTVPPGDAEAAGIAPDHDTP